MIVRTNGTIRSLIILGAALLLSQTGNAQDLFKKHEGNPVFDIGGTQPTWRSLHVANATVLTPSETGDGKWWLFLRGTGNNPDGYHDNIGMFEQEAAGFDPFGSWKEYAGNPNLQHGDSYDALHVLDATAMVASGGKLYVHFMARDIHNNASIAGAVSNDGGRTFSKFRNNPLKKHVGPNDVVFHQNKYYTFYGDAKWNGKGFDDKLQIWVSVTKKPDQINPKAMYAIRTGGEGAFDSESVNGAKIFNVSGDPRWFMIYQVSDKHFDYPARFHAAYSYDLIHWTKVNNAVPLLTRGSIGEWDQGGIWTGGVFEHNGALFIYYEGWGAPDQKGNRDQVYYPEGSSRVGVASTSVADFLKWSGSKR